MHQREGILFLHFSIFLKEKSCYYISFFHISQQKQIKRLFDSYVNFEKEVDNNISSEHAFSFDDLIEDDIFFGEKNETKTKTKTETETEREKAKIYHKMD